MDLVGKPDLQAVVSYHTETLLDMCACRHLRPTGMHTVFKSSGTTPSIHNHRDIVAQVRSSMLLFVREQCRKMQRQEEKGQVAMLTHPEIGWNSHQQDSAVEAKWSCFSCFHSFCDSSSGAEVETRQAARWNLEGQQLWQASSRSTALKSLHCRLTSTGKGPFLPSQSAGLQVSGINSRPFQQIQGLETSLCLLSHRPLPSLG